MSKFKKLNNEINDLTLLACLRMNLFDVAFDQKNDCTDYDRSAAASVYMLDALDKCSKEHSMEDNFFVKNYLTDGEAFNNFGKFSSVLSAVLEQRDLNEEQKELVIDKVQGFCQEMMPVIVASKREHGLYLQEHEFANSLIFNHGITRQAELEGREASCGTCGSESTCASSDSKPTETPHIGEVSSILSNVVRQRSA